MGIMLILPHHLMSYHFQLQMFSAQAGMDFRLSHLRDVGQPLKEPELQSEQNYYYSNR